MDRLAGDLDAYLLADQDPAALQDHVPEQAVALPVDLGLGAETEDVPPVRVAPGAAEVDLQVDLLGDVLDGEVTDEHEPAGRRGGVGRGTGGGTAPTSRKSGLRRWVSRSVLLVSRLAA